MSDAVVVATAATGIDSAVADGNITVTISHGILSVKGAHSGEQITVYGADGTITAQGKVSDNYITTLPVNHTAGTCIIRIGNKVFKTNR